MPTFPSSSDDAVAQADSFVDFLNQNGGLQPVDLRPVLDLKWDIATKNGPDPGNCITPAQITSDVRFGDDLKFVTDFQIR
jgi:hypothetical protein